jgi:predicted DNA-binding transcriptional regulator YafY
MGVFLILERMLWFDREIKVGTYPNAGKFAERFEISTRTARRCIEFMRDRMSAPIEYDSSQKGYYYTNTAFELPHFQVSQEEILSILLAGNLLSKTAGGMIRRSIGKFSKKLFSEIGNLGLDEEKMGRLFSASWSGYSPVRPETFMRVSKALIDEKCLSFTYLSPAKNKTTKRTVEPLHLQYYMASWILIAKCRLRGEYRKFYLSRMNDVIVTNDKFTPDPPGKWRNLIDSAFGIFQGDSIQVVVLRFSPFRSRWIKEQVWHSDQKIREYPDDSLELSLPVSDFREIKLKILQFGADVEVIEPLELKQEIEEEIKKMAKLYKI